MGCDIHLYVEKKIEVPSQGEKWISVDKWIESTYSPGEFEVNIHDQWYIDRCYWLFARLAGVRNYDEIDPVFPARGMPEDASLPVWNACHEWGCDGHSHSWLTIEEMEKIDLSYKSAMAPYGLRGYLNLRDRMQKLLWQKKYIRDIRIVFWFDN